VGNVDSGKLDQKTAPGVIVDPFPRRVDMACFTVVVKVNEKTICQCKEKRACNSKCTQGTKTALNIVK
jgi:hypothetical protein